MRSFRRAIAVLFSVGLMLTACREASPAPAGRADGEKVAPTAASPGDGEPCVMSTPEDGEPVTAEEAEVLGADSVGGELNDVVTTADTRRVCGASYDVWVVTGTLPDGDNTETYITRETGKVIHISISGGSD